MKDQNESLVELAKDGKYREHLIEDLFPAREISLIGGPSGSGKTSFLLKMLETWTAGEAVFGHTSHPTPYAYISGDRSTAGMLRTMDRLGLDKRTFPLYVPAISTLNLTAVQVVENALKRFPDAKLIVFEGIATYVPDGKLHDYKVVAKFLRDLAALCQARDITILGVVHSPKVKEKDKYANPRERIMGSTAWAAYSELIMFLEPKDPDAGTSLREFWILPRNAREEKFVMDWKDGMLVPLKTQSKRSNYERFMEFLSVVPDGGTFTKNDLETSTSMADSSVRFELTKAMSTHLVERVEGAAAGTYRKKAAN